ncbi:MAG: hypothetical protein V1660_01965 [archaeon]
MQKKKEKLEEFLSKEDLVNLCFKEIKTPLNIFYNTENNNTVVYYLFKDSLYKRARNAI